VTLFEGNPEEVCDAKRLPVIVVDPVRDPEEDRDTTGLTVGAMDSDANPDADCVTE
jgi:hypothetical protein